MHRLYDKIVFRLRAIVRDHFISAPRSLYGRALGIQLGAGTALPSISVNWPHQVSIGARCILEPNIHFKFDGIWCPGPSIVVGDDGFIGRDCEFNIRRGITIGHHCLIASGCKFIDHDHAFWTRLKPMCCQADGREAPIRIHDDVWIGVNVIVLKGVEIGRGAIVAAGSVVTHSIPDYSIWGGIPARHLRDRPDEKLHPCAETSRPSFT